VARTAAAAYIPGREPDHHRTECSAMTSTARLFMFMAIYGGFTFLVYLVSLWMIRIEDRRQQARRGPRR
jgi:hypothetical protein